MKLVVIVCALTTLIGGANAATKTSAEKMEAKKARLCWKANRFVDTYLHSEYEEPVFMKQAPANLFNDGATCSAYCPPGRAGCDQAAHNLPCVFHEHGLNNPIHTRTLGPCGAKDATCEVGKGKLKGFCNCWGAGATKEMGAKTGNAFGMTFGEIRKYVNAAGETVGPLVKGAQRGVRDMHSSIYTSVVAEVRTNRCFTTKQFGTQEVPTSGPERGTNRMTFSGKWEVTAGPEMCGVCRDTVSTISLLPWATRGSLAWDFVVGDHCVAMEGFYNSKISGTDYKPNTLYKERNDKIKTLLATCPGSKITSWYPENEKCSELFPEKATWTAGAWNPTVTRGAVFEGEVPLSGKLSIGVEGTLLYGWDKGFVGFESTGKGVTISGKSTIASSGLTGIMVGNCYNVVIDKNTDPWTYTAEESSSTNSRACMSMFLQTTVPECQDSNMNDQQKAMNLFLNEKGVGMVCEAAKEDKRKYNVKNCPQPDSRFDNLREDCNSDCRTWCCPNCVESYVGYEWKKCEGFDPISNSANSVALTAGIAFAGLIASLALM